MSDNVLRISRPSLLCDGSASSDCEPPDASPLSSAATTALAHPAASTQGDSVDVADSVDSSCDSHGADSSTSRGENLISASSERERNPKFSIYKLPIEEQFNLIEKEFSAIEASTMNPRLYNFTTSNANPAKNRYINVLANEETIFPPTCPASAATTTSGSQLSTSGCPPSRASVPSSSIKPFTFTAQKVWRAAGQRLLGTLRGSTLPRGAEGNEEFTADCVAKERPQWYINANVVDMSVEPVFVASQAPVQECIDDFLSVLYSCEVTLVLMLTELEEAGFAKADRYWPSDNTPADRIESFGNMCVYKDQQDPYTYDAAHQLVRRPFYTRPSSEPRARAHKVVMYQYVGWPDRGVPDSTESFEELLRIIRHHVVAPPPSREPVAGPEGAAHSPSALNSGVDNSTKKPESNTGVGRLTPPVFVHCSAGIGRTGTLIGAYTAIKLTEAGLLTNASIRRIVTDMRKARFGMVQRVEQYMFLYMIVLQHMGIDAHKFSARMQPRADLYNMRWMEAKQRALLEARAGKR